MSQGVRGENGECESGINEIKKLRCGERDMSHGVRDVRARSESTIKEGCESWGEGC